MLRCQSFGSEATESGLPREERERVAELSILVISRGHVFQCALRLKAPSVAQATTLARRKRGVKLFP